LATIICGIFFLTCEEPLPTSALDTGSSDYELPETTIVDGPSSTNITTISTVTFTFSGNELVTEFSYSLVFESGDQVWSDWFSDSTVTLEKLDEGSHTFYVKGRYSNEDEDPTPAEQSFTIDAVQGPSIRVFPQVITVKENSVFDIHVYAEEISEDGAVAGMEIQLEYDDQTLQYREISKGQLLTDYLGTNIFIDEHTSGDLTITIGITEEGSNEGLMGTGSLFSISFNAQAVGISNINIISAELRDPENNTITINQQISGSINIVQ